MTTPDTVVLLHGLWVTPRSWEAWIERYEARGLRVLAPAYPGFDAEVEALRADPSVVAAASFAQTVEHLAGVVAAQPTPPVLIGHSLGGLLVQLLLARGLGAAGVAIDSAPPEGVRTAPPSQVRALLPVLRNPRTRGRAVMFTPEQFHYAFTNTLTEDHARAVYERYAVAAPGRWVWDYGLLAHYRPGHQETWVDWSAPRPPLLFLAGGSDHIMPPSVNRANARRWASSPSRTELYEFPGRDHWTCGAPGWEAVADHALAWAMEAVGDAPQRVDLRGGDARAASDG